MTATSVTLRRADAAADAPVETIDGISFLVIATGSR